MTGEYPLGADTAEIVASFVERGWSIDESDTGRVWLRYPHGVGDALGRCERIAACDIGITVPYCTLTERTVTVESCGVEHGCPDHAPTVETLPLAAPHLPDRLAHHEHRAATIDLRALAWCVLFGPCARPRADLSNHGSDHVSP